jgi:cytochrome c2
VIKIRTQPHTEFAARHLVNQLARLGKPAQIIDHIDPNSKDLHIIYNSHELHVLPKRWICMQTEIAQSHWFNAEYLAKMRKALAVWDYSEINQQYYHHPRKAIVTPGYAPQPVREKNIDWIFYGWIEGSDRREKILKHHYLQNLHNTMLFSPITIITNTLGPTLWEILSRAKEVINIHYYDNSPPELYRIKESLSHGCKVYMHDEDYYYEDIGDNFEELKTAISKL